MDIEDVKLFLFDLDGTVYLGDKLIEGSAKFLSSLKSKGRKVVFLTNNSSKSAEEYVNKLNGMGIDCGKDDIFSSADVAYELLNEKFKGKRVFVLGTEALRQSLLKRGVIVTDNDPQVVLLGYDTELTYKKLCIAVTAIAQGATYICTHSDINCPASPVFLPDAGSMIKLIGTSTGKYPEYDCGKPYTLMGNSIKQRFALKENEIAMVGDRLYTDIRFGLTNGFYTILTFSGETTKKDYEKFGERVNMEVNKIADIPV